MARSRDDEYLDPDDPQARLRARLTSQYTDPADDPAQTPDPTPTTSEPSTTPAPFNEAQPVTGDYTQPAPPVTGDYPDYYDPHRTGEYQPPPAAAAPTPTAATPAAAAPTPPGTGAPVGGRTAEELRQIVQNWPNPYGHRDPDYWVNKLLTADNGGPTDANIAYFKGRYLEDPNNNAHTPKNIAPTPGAFTSPGSPGGVNYGVPGQSVAQSFVAGMQSPQGLWDRSYIDAIRKILQERMTAAGQPVDPHSPQIEGTVTAARDEATRMTHKERTALAERLYAEGGLNTDALSQKIQQSGERNATALGSLRATLMQREAESRRTELRELMQLALASGDADAEREIRMQIAALDAMMREEGMNVDLEKFGKDLDYRYTALGAGA